jgi:hypothetical protein
MKSIITEIGFVKIILVTVLSLVFFILVFTTIAEISKLAK